MTPGDPVTLSGGPFAGLEAIIVRAEGERFIVQVELFGRKTEVPVSRDDLEDADPRPRLRERIAWAYDRWSWHQRTTWWRERSEGADAPDTSDWLAFEAFREKVLAPLEAEREALLRRFDATFVDPSGVRARFDADPSWLEGARAWNAVVEARKQRIQEDPGFAETDRAALSDAHAFERGALRARMRTNPAAAEARRREALAWALARREAVGPGFTETFGFPLPRQTAEFVAFWRSLDDVERRGADQVWRYPTGILTWYEDDFAAWELIEGLDHRLHYRYRAAPPELVCVLTGDSDGLNYGLWVEDPREEPHGVAAFYARDDATVTFCGATVLEAYRLNLEHAADALQHDRTLPYDERLEREVELELLREAVCAFDTSDRAETGADYVRAYPTRALGAGRVATLDGIGVRAAFPVALTDRPATIDGLHQVYRDEPARVAGWVEEARTALAAGDPFPALIVGRDLHARHWDDAAQPTALALLAAAYRALGRDALAAIAEVHHAHRDLPSVGVYVRASHRSP